MADDPRRAVMTHWRHIRDIDAGGALPARNGYHQPQPLRPPAAACDAVSSVPVVAAAAAAPPRSLSRPHTTQHHNTAVSYGAGRAGHPPPARTRLPSADDERKGADPADSPGDRDLARKGRPTQTDRAYQFQQQPQPVSAVRATATATTATATARDAAERDAYDQRREKQRVLQMQLARMMDAHHRVPAAASTASSAVPYYELVSPARTMEAPSSAARLMENRRGYDGNQTDDDAAIRHHHHQRHGAQLPTTSGNRRAAPSDVMREFDEDLSRSIDEHHRPSLSMSRDVADMRDELSDDDEAVPSAFANGAAGGGRTEQPSYPTTTLPSVHVRIQQQQPYPPFREEISSDASEHVSARSPPPSMDPDGNPYVTSHVPTSEDLGVHFPMSNDFDSVPSISMTPPASPIHRPHTRQATPSSQGHHGASAVHATPQGDATRVVSPTFPAWSLGFLAGCFVVGAGGIFMEELLDFAGVYLKTTPLPLSRSEQREMNRRLDLLQHELLSFRTAANDIEQQSQRMVHEVRVHLDKMKTERERHQLMIAQEMETLRRYVQGVTNELVEDEKKEIRKRLMETIADTMMERAHDDTRDDSNEAKNTSIEIERQDERLAVSSDDMAETAAVDVIEVEIAAAQSNAAELFASVDEEAVMHQIEQAIAIAVDHGHAASPLEAIAPPLVDANVTASSSVEDSLFSTELMLLLMGVLAIAGAVGARVRTATRRKNIYRGRRPSRFVQQFQSKKPSMGSTSDESEVETVSFFRSEGEDGDEEAEQDEDSEDARVYSEEQKDGDDGDDSFIACEESVSMSSDTGDYEFHPAQFSGDFSNISEIEPLDESPSFGDEDAPTPLDQSKFQRQLEQRLQAEDSPSVRRSPRIQLRSNLSYMR